MFRSAGARLVAFASLGFACVRAPGPVRVARLVLGWVGVLLPAAGFFSPFPLFSGFGFGWVVVLVGFELYRRARARVWDAGRLRCGTFSDASCFCVVGSFSAFRIFSHFRWASCSLCELHLRERILHRIVEFRSPLRGALWQPAVQPHFVLAVRRGAVAEFRKACFRLSAECVRRDWKCVYRAELMKYPLSRYNHPFRYCGAMVDSVAIFDSPVASQASFFFSKFSFKFSAGGLWDVLRRVVYVCGR